MAMAARIIATVAAKARRETAASLRSFGRLAVDALTGCCSSNPRMASPPGVLHCAVVTIVKMFR